ncbi:MAG: aldehyde dehydrogenase family protein [Alphaproteobacteria bacterium]|nr:aldehyde dehydrogenase family protein [Alphaproteobacteria bacterium]MCB9975383.1 aldehyde dehydrogenase family protein [Rhodospirillales bacterium]
MTQEQEIFAALGLDRKALSGGDLEVFSPIDGAKIAAVKMHSAKDAEKIIAKSVKAFEAWRSVPAPRRGELVRIYGEILRENKEALGQLVTLECGKILQEGLGEVQEMIDICDFAVGLSRQLYGLTITSERPAHKMREIWHPAGPVGIISAFNFPVAVWAWNAALALVCGDSVIWKPSEKTPVTALACQALFLQACKRFGTDAPDGLSQLLIGDREIGAIMVDDQRVPVISATGSCAMGRIVGPRVAQRFGRSILELGGNNAIIVAPSADLDLAFQGIVFGAVGTAGQRCTTTRRVFVHKSIYAKFVGRLKKAYGKLSIGNPLEAGTLVGPLIDKQAYENMEKALKAAKKHGGVVTGGGRALAKQYPKGYYVNPALVEMKGKVDNVHEETFAPILYVFSYTDIKDAIARQNAVPQGLSSAIFTNDLREAEVFTCEAGSDCGIANVNIGTSGAEIGGAFGGEKETGGGRESGSDSWKAYMRRVTSTVNYSDKLPLAQGIAFNVGD